jgi:hypothetical protein
MDMEKMCVHTRAGRKWGKVGEKKKTQRARSLISSSILFDCRQRNPLIFTSQMRGAPMQA